MGNSNACCVPGQVPLLTTVVQWPLTLLKALSTFAIANIASCGIMSTCFARLLFLSWRVKELPNHFCKHSHVMLCVCTCSRCEVLLKLVRSDGEEDVVGGGRLA